MLFDSANLVLSYSSTTVILPVAVSRPFVFSSSLHAPPVTNRFQRLVSILFSTAMAVMGNNENRGAACSYHSKIKKDVVNCIFST